MVSSQRYIHSGIESAYLKFCKDSFIEKICRQAINYTQWLGTILVRSIPCFPLNVYILYKVPESLPEVKQ